MTTSHHLAEWKTILEFGEREWNIVDARVFPPKFPNPRTLPDGGGGSGPKGPLRIFKSKSRRVKIQSAIAGRSDGSHRSTLRIAYQSYVRSLFDYGASVYFTHAAPAVREHLEVEQRKCSRP